MRILIALVALLSIVDNSFAVMPSAGEGKKPNVLILMLDTLRADHLSFNGYERDTSPVIDAFAAENLNFVHAVSAAPWTPASIATMFTGLYPSAHGMMPRYEHNDVHNRPAKLNSGLLTLAELFKKNGYQTAAVSSNAWIKKDFGFEQGFDIFRHINRASATKVNKEGVEILEGMSEQQEPFFLYLHYMDPHYLQRPPELFKKMYKGPLRVHAYPELQQKRLRLYDSAIRYLDTELGKLLSHLKQKGLYKDLVIVLICDHGEQFMEHGDFGHGYQLHNEEIHVALIIKGAGKSAQVEDTVSTVDMLPTLLELTGIKSPQSVQGYSLISELEKRKATGILSEIKNKFNQKAYVNPAGKKLIIDYPMGQDLLLGKDAQAQAVSIFDSWKDQFGEHQIDDAKLREELSAAFNKLYNQTQSLRGRRTAEEAVIDPKTAKELQSLGYL